MKIRISGSSLSLILLSIISVFLTGTANAVDKFVRKGATGNGSSWTDAYGELDKVDWTGMSGSTLWIAAGTYSTGFPTVNVANVTVKRATISNHGFATGWLDSYDGQVTVTPALYSKFLLVSSSADGFTIDGVGKEPWKFRVAGVRGYNGMVENSGADNFVIRGLELDGMGETRGYGEPEDGIRWMGGVGGVIEHSYIHDYRQNGEAHNDGIQGPSCNNITIRYNRFKNNGMHVFLGDYDWGSRYCNGITIHHNVFYNDNNGGSYNCIVFKGTNVGGAFTNKIENNTFNLRGQGSVLYLADYPSPGCCNDLRNSYFRNNILYSSSTGDVGFYQHTNNLYFNSGSIAESGRVTLDPLFLDPNNNDYRLKATSPAIGAGLAVPYSVDYAGTPLSQPVDIGAFEFSSGSLPPAPLRAPANLRLISFSTSN